MATNDAEKELAVVQQIISGLAQFEQGTQVRLLQTVMTFLELHPSTTAGPPAPHANAAQHHAAQTSNMTESAGAPSVVPTPKAFLFDKQPKSDIERVLCLGYYLTHYAGVPHFKTFDLSKLNTEAAQQKLSNTAQAVVNANNRGLIVAAGAGKKQLSTMGEHFIQALPDRDAAKEVLEKMRIRKHRKHVQKDTAADATNPESVQ